MKVTYDKAADALYIRLTEARIAESDEARPGFVIDYDADGLVVGIELLNASLTIKQPGLVELQVA